MRSGPHHRNIGCLDASRRLTVVNRVSDQVSIGPSGLPAQPNWRTSSAISPSPIIRGEEASRIRRFLRLLELELREVSGMGQPNPAKSADNISYCGIIESRSYRKYQGIGA